MILRGHLQEVRAAVFSPDGTRLLTTSVDGTVILWDVTTGQNITAMSTQRFYTTAQFSPDGNLVLTSSTDTVRLWDVRPFYGPRPQ